MAQDGDARYLAFEVLSGVITTAADVFSLGMAGFELVSDYDLPVNGDVWTEIRDGRLPFEITSALTDVDLKKLLFRMIDSDYKLRPSAKDVLDCPTIRNQVKINKKKSILTMFKVIFHLKICHLPSPFAFHHHRFDHVSR